jgi:hypothetical protein
MAGLIEMEKSVSKTKGKPAGDLTALEIQAISDQLVALRRKIRDCGATVLSPTPEWDSLRREIALLNKSLSADASAKVARSRELAQ